MFEVWALQHLAAAAVLEPEAQAEGARPRVERAAALLGFVDARLAELGGVREYTERQEYDRVLTALRARLGDPCARATHRARTSLEWGARVHGGGHPVTGARVVPARALERTRPPRP